jgi:hypothetical protein
MRPGARPIISKPVLKGEIRPLREEGDGAESGGAEGGQQEERYGEGALHSPLVIRVGIEV